jgi:hypothetical protein
MAVQSIVNAWKSVMSLRLILALISCSLFGFLSPTVILAATEPAVNTMPIIDPPGATNYFDLRVNYTVPADATGVLVVVRQTYSPVALPTDNTLYTANARIGAGDTTQVCAIYCEWVVADATANGSVMVTGLKAGTKHYFAVYAYNKVSDTDINYNQTIDPAINVASATTAAALTAAGRSHNELWVAGNSPKDGVNWGTMTSADCVTACHAQHHTAQILPRGQAQMDACVTCHNGTSATDNIGLHPADESVDCGSCHSLHSFKTEELYSTDHSGNKAFNLSFVRKNMSKYINPTMYPPPSGGGATTALDNTVFQDRTTDFAFRDGDAPYNGVCQTCHTTAAHHTQISSDNHHVDGGTGANDLCTSCHNHQGGFAAGGHTVDFGNDASCTAAGCHTGANVVSDIHKNNCANCHSGSPSRDNEMLGARGLGDARNADGTAAAGTWASITCITCHDVTPPVDPDLTVSTLGGMHHGHANATGGNCIACHLPDVGQTGSDALRGNLTMPANLACNFCHLWWPNNKTYYTSPADSGYGLTATNKVKIFRLNWDPNNTTQKTYAASSEIVNHSVSENSITPISDYAACFACHGASSATKGGGFQVRPFHGFGPAVTGFEPLSGDSGTVNVNIEWYAGPTTSGQDQPARTTPWHPGFAAFNWLAADVRPVTGTKQFSSDTRNAHKLDWNKPWTSATRLSALTPSLAPFNFNIPWDNYGPTPGGPTGTSDSLNTGGQTGSFTKLTNVPLVPLSLPTSITP